MRRLLAVGLIATLLPMTGCLSGDASLPEFEGMVPDASYRPGVGDRSVLFGVVEEVPLERLPLLNDVTAYDLFERAYHESDVQKWADLEEQGWLRWTPAGTRVLVLALHGRGHTGAGVAAQIRILDGPHKNRTAWTSARFITRFRQHEDAA